MKNIIFLDIDGVLNCELHYQSEQFNEYKQQFMGPMGTMSDHYKSRICKDRIRLLSELCMETDSVVVVSSTWRGGKCVQELQDIFDYCGGTFKVLDKTGHCDSGVRGVEIYQWLKDNCMKQFGVHYYDFYRYAIIDDDSDMLLNQANHFFQTDTWAGLTPNTTYKIKRFFTHETF